MGAIIRRVAVKVAQKVAKVDPTDIITQENVRFIGQLAKDVLHHIH